MKYNIINIVIIFKGYMINAVCVEFINNVGSTCCSVYPKKSIATKVDVASNICASKEVIFNLFFNILNLFLNNINGELIIIHNINSTDKVIKEMPWLIYNIRLGMQIIEPITAIVLQ